ncbi:cytochrome d ubiquinol oxidase subunit II [Enterobacteriaceae endosymbiont of Donacia cincticornis]|uniref:cytochrome d ubiquinol oxidase subunit II n=1 Tax=Enterobacteriaceae endosymbiont of Donacia cincticornis TaxID=2675773 RepID=UPI001448DC75|nr:cytochrome d ubiquinol oxidase subunit II [Enterobacteriaceae endosymbiont of Donacia cincticornis]QJC36090.1 cytochrome d ubiquinol oxidase subunit II [Enterobacteriaceae endosymbiont of Donacia cincticornis]
MLNHKILCIIWSLIISVLMTGSIITNGLDMGVGILLFLIGKDNIERRIMINTIAPHWDGNQVWLITTAAALFAAWPIVYATIFSCFYIPIILLLISLFLRPIGFEYRSKIKNKIWQKMCDIFIFTGSIIPPFIFGIILGNIFKGIPFYMDKYYHIFFKGYFLSLFNLSSILISITIIIMITNHAASYLQIRIKENSINYKLNIILKLFSILLIIFFILSFISTIIYTKGYKINSLLYNNNVNNFLIKSNDITHEKYAWVNNFRKNTYLCLIPLLSIIFSFLMIISSIYKKIIATFIFSTLNIISTVITVGIAMFPFIIPSSIRSIQSLTIWNSTSSTLTLKIMLYIVIIFMPIILIYTVWCYKKMFFYINKKEIKKKSDFYY